jgi:uncharacterized membrane protein
MSDKISQTMENDAPLSAAKNPDTEQIEGGEASLVGRTVTINRPRDEVYAYWRDLQNLPSFMENVEAVRVIDDRVSHWTVTAPAGQSVEWDSIIVEDEPGRLIAWKSSQDAAIPNSGRIEFRDSPVGRGTEVTATILYDPPAGTAGKLVAKLFQKEPNIQARRELRRFKQLMETGEVSTAKPPHAAPRAE